MLFLTSIHSLGIIVSTIQNSMMIILRFLLMIPDISILSAMITSCPPMIDLKNVTRMIDSPAGNMEESIAVLPITFMKTFHHTMRAHMGLLRQICFSQ